MSSTAAFFDVDGTIVKGNIVSYYARIRCSGMSPIGQALWILGFLPKVLYYFLLDKRSRRRVNVVFYRNYAGMSSETFEKGAREHAREHLQPNVFPEANERIERHHRLGEPVVLVSGSLGPIVQPLAEALGIRHVFAAEVEVRDGILTGNLEVGPLTDHEKARVIREFAREHDIDLTRSVAYADSLDDVPMLMTTGRAGVVNPGSKLRNIAAEKGWEILNWDLQS